MTSQPPASPRLPADACPHRRPFPDDFAVCPAYQPVRMVPLDSRHNALRPIWTCAHLDIGRIPPHRSYARCRLGDAAQRSAWSTGFEPERF